MSSNTMNAFRTIPAVLAALAVLLTVSTPAKAETQEQTEQRVTALEASTDPGMPPSPSSADSWIGAETTLTGDSTTMSIGSSSFVDESGVPYSCFGRSDNPHRSTHRPGYVTAQGIIDCRGSRPYYIKVKSYLYRYSSGRYSLMDADTDACYFICSKQEAHPATPCSGGRSYYLKSMHYVQDYRGNYSIAWTGNAGWVNC